MKLSPKSPTKKITPGTAIVETGLVKDRWKGYKSSPDHPGFNPTGADARAALVGGLKKKRKGFPSHEKGETKKHERYEGGEEDEAY